MSFFSDLETAIAAEAKVIWSKIEPLAEELKPIAIATAEEVATIALNAVMAQAPLVLSGSEKLAAATAAVITGLGTQSKSVLATNAEAAVQTAYNFLSGALATPKTSTGQ